MSMSTLVFSLAPGGLPDQTDLILSSVFIALFLATGLYFHFRLFHAYGKKFVYSILCFGFCMARCGALAVRIAITQHQTDKPLNIIGQVLIAAGVLLLYIVLLQLSRRFFGQLHPRHSLAVKRFVLVVCWLIPCILVMTITTVVQSFLTTDQAILEKDRDVRIAAFCFFLAIAFLPTAITILVLVLKAVQDKGISQPSSVVVDEDPEEGEAEKPREAPPRTKGEPVTGFGPAPVSEREILETASIIILPSMLMTWEQGIRIAQVLYRPVPGQPQPWYMSKATFWVSIFAVEWIAVLILGFAVLPHRFSHLKLI